MGCCNRFVKIALNVNKKIIAILGIVSLAVFFRILGHDFLTWDDDINIYQNYHLRQSLWTALELIWSQAYYALYIPVTYTVWLIIAKLSLAISGQHSSSHFFPVYFHAASLLTHAINGFLVFKIIELLNSQIKSEVQPEAAQADWLYCLLASLLFVIHPVQVETVAWATGLKDLLACGFGFAAIYIYLESRKRQNQRLYFIATALFTLGILSKPNIVIVPLMILLLRKWVFKVNLRRDFVKLLPWFIVAGAITLYSRSIQPLALQKYVPEFWVRPFLVGDTFLFYCAKLIFPLSLSPIYGRTPEYVISSRIVFATSALFFTFTYFIWRYRKLYRLTWTVFTTILLAILPVSGLLTFAYQDVSTVADRYLYLPMLGVAWGASLLLRKFHHRFTSFGFIAVLAVFGVKSMAQTSVWKNNLTLFEHAAALDPKNAIINNNYGLSLMNVGRPQDAIVYFQRAIEVDAKHKTAWNNVGLAYRRLKQFERAAAHYESMLKAGVDSPEARNNYALTLIDIGRRFEAFDQFREAINQKSDYLDAYLNLAQNLYISGQYDEAKKYFEASLRIDPNNPIARKYLSNYNH